MNLILFLTRLDKLTQVLRSRNLLRALVRYLVLAGAEHRHILRPELATVMDIGANRGQFSLAVRRWSPGARVFAFEPLPSPAARFRKVFEGDSRVILHPVAIGPALGETTIHVSAADDSSSLLPISRLQEQLFPGTGEVRTEMVKVGRLADFVSAQEIVEPAMLKLDVQGYELEALGGCEDLLGSFSNVYVECSFVELYQGQAMAEDIIAWLHDRGFTMRGVYNLKYDEEGKSVQGDFLFTNNPNKNKETLINRD